MHLLLMSLAILPLFLFATPARQFRLHLLCRRAGTRPACCCCRPAAIGCAAIPPNLLCVAFACSECSSIVHLMKRLPEAMPYHRNFTYHIDKRRWKYHFLMVALCENRQR